MREREVPSGNEAPVSFSLWCSYDSREMACARISIAKTPSFPLRPDDNASRFTAVLSTLSGDSGSSCLGCQMESNLSSLSFPFLFLLFKNSAPGAKQLPAALPSSISGTRSRATRLSKAYHDEENTPTIHVCTCIVLVFSFFCFAGFFCEKIILACCLA